MPDLTPSERVLRARAAAYALHARRDSKEIANHAHQGFLARFEREVDPDGILDPAERAHRAEMARKSYFTALALKSAKARRRAREQAAIADAADVELRAADAPGEGVQSA